MVNYRMLMYGLLAIGMLVVLWTLIRRDKNEASDFHMDDLLLDPETRTASPAQCLMIAAFFLLVWMMIYLTVTQKMDHEYFNSFGQLFVVPFVMATIQRIGKAFAGRRPAPPAPVAPSAVTVNSVVEQQK